MKLNRYVSHGFRSVLAESFADATVVFANREARRQFGRRGYARTLNLGSYAADGSLAEYSAFIGYTTGLNQTTGRNTHITVRRCDTNGVSHGANREARANRDAALTYAMQTCRDLSADDRIPRKLRARLAQVTHHRRVEDALDDVMSQCEEKEMVLTCITASNAAQRVSDAFRGRA